MKLRINCSTQRLLRGSKFWLHAFLAERSCEPWVKL